MSCPVDCTTIDALAKKFQIVQSIIVDIASAIAGLWAFFRLRRERTYEPALKIQLEIEPIEGESKFTFLVVTLTNQGRAKLAANQADGTGPVYGDKNETIHHSCNLEIRKVDATAPAAVSAIDWYDSKLLSPAIADINLLREYQNPDTRHVEFWLEPGEVCRLGSLVCLEPGLYLAKVVFLGRDVTEDYWSQVSCIRIPALL